MSPALLELRDVALDLPDRAGKRWLRAAPSRTVLNGISLDVQAGECLGLVGESGCGKTTLGRTVMRLFEPQRGSIRFGGDDITHLAESALRERRARMQMIFQDPLSSLNPRHTVAQIVMQPLHEYGRVDQRVGAAAQAAQLLAQVSLTPDFLGRYPHQLSGGQRQRVGIARAIALQPQLIVADEIVSGLDVSTQARILLLLADLRSRLGMAMLFVTHDLSVVRVLCDRVAVLKEGRIVEIGATEEIFARPRHPYTRALLEAIPLPDYDESWLDGGAGNSIGGRVGCAGA